MEANPVQVFQQWEDAQKALGHAMQRYLDNFGELQSSLYSHDHSTEYVSARNTVAETWLNDSSASDKLSVLARAQVHLNQIHNSVLSINKLPLKALLQVLHNVAFHALNTQNYHLVPLSYQRNDHKNLLALTHVCSHWRSILLDAPSFWSRFELDKSLPIGSECQRAEVYLDRARGIPQDLLLEQPNFNPYSYNGDSGKMLRLLEARLDTLTYLALLNFTEVPLIMRSITCLLRDGKPGILRTLVIHMEGQLQRREPIYRESPKFAERSSLILSPISALSLHGVNFVWDCPVYHNLTLLHISHIPHDSGPDIRDMLRILSASPLLHTLKLSRMSIRPSIVSAYSKPISLPHLERLDLVSVSHTTVNLLLPIIYAQYEGLSICITWAAHEDHSVPVIQQFLNRTNVAQLLVQQSMVAQCLPFVPDLRALVIDLGLRPENLCLSEFFQPSESGTLRIPWCPKLRALHLHSGSVSIEAIQAVVEAHPLLQKLGFSACYVEPFEEELRYWLKPYIKDVQFNLRLDEEAVFDWSQFMV